MATFYSELDESLRHFIAQQKVFFTATAPVRGRINVSPKGMDTFRCLDARTVCYLDLTGSGSEASAHLMENGRMTIMFCSFSEKPLILRLYGKGEVIRPGHPRWAEFSTQFASLPGQRHIIVLHIDSAQTSCGYAVPLLEFKEERKVLCDWADKKGPDGMQQYRREKNARSIDGLPTGLVES
jgi:hypothetical protein